jgi:hypothetical protein
VIGAEVPATVKLPLLHPLVTGGSDGLVARFVAGFAPTETGFDPFAGLVARLP